MNNESEVLNWHSIETDVIIGGLRVGQLGSLKRILNDKDEPITTGYHSFYMKEGTLRGQRGATDEIVTYESPDQVRALEEMRDRQREDCINSIISRREDEDPVNNPKHYTEHPSGVECIQVTEHMGFNLGNAVKYIWRSDLKNDAIEDLEKAAWYINREIKKRKT